MDGEDPVVNESEEMEEAEEMESDEENQTGELMLGFYYSETDTVWVGFQSSFEVKHRNILFRQTLPQRWGREIHQATFVASGYNEEKVYARLDKYYNMIHRLSTNMGNPPQPRAAVRRQRKRDQVNNAVVAAAPRLQPSAQRVAKERTLENKAKKRSSSSYERDEDYPEKKKYQRRRGRQEDVAECSKAYERREEAKKAKDLKKKLQQEAHARTLRGQNKRAEGEEESEAENEPADDETVQQCKNVEETTDIIIARVHLEHAESDLKKAEKDVEEKREKKEKAEKEQNDAEITLARARNNVQGWRRIFEETREKAVKDGETKKKEKEAHEVLMLQEKQRIDDVIKRERELLRKEEELKKKVSQFEKEVDQFDKRKEQERRQPEFIGQFEAIHNGVDNEEEQRAVKADAMERNTVHRQPRDDEIEARETIEETAASKYADFAMAVGESEETYAMAHAALLAPMTPEMIDNKKIPKERKKQPKAVPHTNEAKVLPRQYRLPFSKDTTDWKSVVMIPPTMVGPDPSVPRIRSPSPHIAVLEQSDDDSDPISAVEVPINKRKEAAETAVKRSAPPHPTESHSARFEELEDQDQVQDQSSTVPSYIHPGLRKLWGKPMTYHEFRAEAVMHALPTTPLNAMTKKHDEKKSPHDTSQSKSVSRNVTFDPQNLERIRKELADREVAPAPALAQATRDNTLRCEKAVGTAKDDVGTDPIPDPPVHSSSKIARARDRQLKKELERELQRKDLERRFQALRNFKLPVGSDEDMDDDEEELMWRKGDDHTQNASESSLPSATNDRGETDTMVKKNTKAVTVENGPVASDAAVMPKDDRPALLTYWLQDAGVSHEEIIDDDTSSGTEDDMASNPSGSSQSASPPIVAPSNEGERMESHQ